MDEKSFIVGFGIACVNLSRDHNEDDLAEFLIRDSGISYEQFEASWLEEYDLRELRKIIVR